jgi:hypothetical protein
VLASKRFDGSVADNIFRINEARLAGRLQRDFSTARNYSAEIALCVWMMFKGSERRS